LVPTSRMMSSAIASGSENSFGIKMRPGHKRTADPPWNRGRGPAKAIAHLHRTASVTNRQQAGRRIPVVMSGDRLPVATPPPKQVDVTRPSAGADGP
jgi:hypothetical protein